MASAFSVAYSLRFIHGAFFGPDPVRTALGNHATPEAMGAPLLWLPLLLAGSRPRSLSESMAFRSVTFS